VNLEEALVALGRLKGGEPAKKAVEHGEKFFDCCRVYGPVRQPVYEILRSA